MSDLSGKTLGQYQILEPIGSGGMAQIYRAFQPSMKREVVVKVLSPALRDTDMFAEQFMQEADVIAHLQHPHIIPVYDFGKHEDDLYIVMAYMRGGTLASRIGLSDSGLPDNETIRLFDMIAEGLDYAHSKEIVHRDLKPNNILMDEGDNPYLADFGLAKFTEGKIELTNTMMTGTAAYMAPEIAQSGKSNKRSDIYALGIILFEMLTGHLPYQGDTPYKVLSAHIHQPIPKIHAYRPDLPEAVQEVIEKSIAKDPVNRFESAKGIATALRVAMNPVDATAKQKEATPAQPEIRPLLWILPTMLVAILALAGAFNFASRRTIVAAPPPTAALPTDAPSNPTQNIARAFTSPDGDTRWTFGCLGDSTTALVDLECQEIEIAVENHILPHNFIFLETNEPGGMDYDMWWEICTRLHCQPIFIEEKWETLLTKVEAGVYDAASEGITITDERKQVLDFSISYMNIEQRLVVRKGEARFTNITDFLANEELIVGVLVDSTNFQIASQFIPAERIRTYREFSTIFYALTIGEIDAAIADQTADATTVSGIDFQQAVNLEFIGNSLSSDQFGVVFPKGSDLVEPVNRALHDMRAQGVLDTLVQRFFGSEFRVTYNDVGLGAYGQ